MIRLVLLFFLLLSLSGFSQETTVKKLSPEEALAFSKQHLQKANWFMEIPQYNFDSAEYYASKALAHLNEHQPLHYPQLASIFFKKFATIYQTGSNRDSIARKGWTYAEQLDNNEENRILRYEYLIRWAQIKLEAGQQNEGRKLFQDALSYLKTNESTEFQMTILLDKGYTYNRFGSPEDKVIAIKYLRQCYAYFDRLDKTKNANAFYLISEALSGFYTYFADKSDSVYYYKSQQKLFLNYIRDPKKLAIYYSTLGRELITNPLPGNTTISQAQYEEGRSNIHRAIEIITTYKVKNGSNILPYSYGLLADLDLKAKKYDEAILNYKKSYDGYINANAQFGAIDMLSFIGEAYRQKGDLAKALKYKEQYFNEWRKYETERNDRSLRESELQVNVLNQKQELEDKDNQQKIFISALVIGSILIGLIFYNYRLKQKSSKRFEALNHDLENKNNQLDKRNAENELLLKEIHHRVKNNLEVVSSLLALQSAQIDDAQTKEAMLEGQNRVNSIGIVHQKLYQGENLGAIEMKDYFLNLGENIIDTFGANQKVELEVAMDKLNVDIDTAVPLGLIVNELLTNTLKYAFEPGQNGKVSIQLEKQSNGTLHLEVADNGKGKSSIIKGTGFGSQLVMLLTKQLNGIMREENQDGTRIIFDFEG